MQIQPQTCAKTLKLKEGPVGLCKKNKESPAYGILVSMREGDRQKQYKN